MKAGDMLNVQLEALGLQNMSEILPLRNIRHVSDVYACARLALTLICILCLTLSVAPLCAFAAFAPRRSSPISLYRHGEVDDWLAGKREQRFKV
jgi:hypothetical protein